MIKIKFKSLHDHAMIPKKATTGSAGFDLYATSYHYVDPGERAFVSLGFAIELPPGYEAQVRSRSGNALKHGVFVLNGIGTVDSDYRGEMKVILQNLGENPFVVNVGDRVAQLVVSKVPEATFVEVDELSDTMRGQGGFGST